MEVLQGFFCHLHLPLGHKDVLAREAAQLAGVGHDLHQIQPTRVQGSAPQYGLQRPWLHLTLSITKVAALIQSLVHSPAVCHPF